MAAAGSKKVLFLYVITNLVNGKRYVGISRDVGTRLSQHFAGSGSRLVLAAKRKYGRANLHTEILCCGEDSFIKEMEQRAVAMLRTKAPHGYNLSDGGDGNHGWVPTEEMRAKMRMASARRVRPPLSIGTRHRISDSHKKAVVIAGEQFDSVLDAATILAVRHGVSHQCMKGRIRRARKNGDWSLLSKSSAELYAEGIQRARPKKGRSVTVDGVVYPTLGDAAAACGLDYQNFWKRVTACREDKTWKYLRMTETEFRSSRCKKNKQIELDGVVYPSIKAAAVATGVNYSTLRDRIRQRTIAA